jgi:hypothetical protein
MAGPTGSGGGADSVDEATGLPWLLDLFLDLLQGLHRVRRPPLVAGHPPRAPLHPPPPARSSCTRPPQASLPERVLQLLQRMSAHAPFAAALSDPVATLGATRAAQLEGWRGLALVSVGRAEEGVACLSRALAGDVADVALLVPIVKVRVAPLRVWAACGPRDLHQRPSPSAHGMVRRSCSRVDRPASPVEWRRVVALLHAQSSSPPLRPLAVSAGA